jgi:hypothetical protein
LVGASYNLAGRAGKDVDVVPLVNVPLGGITAAHEVRALLDFDAWLVGAQIPGVTVLQEARAAMWDIMRESSEMKIDTSSYNLLMPFTLRNNRKRPFLSEPPTSPVPTAVPPFDAHSERKVVGAILGAINAAYGLGLDPVPDLDRELDPAAVHNTGRTVVIGASHMGKIATELAAAGVTVLDYSVPGWLANHQTISRATEQVTGADCNTNDRILLDLWSNAAYLGSDVMGFPVRAARSSQDGKYHLPGELQAAPKAVCMNILRESLSLVKAAAAGGARIIFILPLPRYLANKCCSDIEHITNFCSAGYQNEVGKAADNVLETIRAP